ncbi:hypothetical protein [Synechococcus sp. PCC 6312]|uniref:hypothetical protein n=1 Tax=Synechococcus sp. (strain ATCC 27167 / PCC 6312) TaxID=195253 RepID=UPI0002D43A78|nr:hypothetical protein [Synechococcus sp. PCC 6312]
MPSRGLVITAVSDVNPIIIGHPPQSTHPMAWPLLLAELDTRHRQLLGGTILT